MKRRITSWGRFAEVEHSAIIDISPDTKALEVPLGAPLLPFGMGRSYGDVCLNEGGALLRTTRLNQLLAFDRGTGVIRVQAGMTIQDLLSIIVPAGWFIPVSPGTQFVTVGGAIANDVHGKNHHRDGTIGRFLQSFELWRSDGERLECSPGQNDELFTATIGGLGLTGLISQVEIQLRRISSRKVLQRTTRFDSLIEFAELNDEACARSQYTVDWIDAMAPARSRGRGLYLEGDFARSNGADLHRTRPSARLKAPMRVPGLVINRASARAFNAAYWRRQRWRTVARTVDYQRFFYPLDAIANWTRLYGAGGFFQHQSVVPMADGLAVVDALLQRISAYKATAPLAVLKTFGELPSPGLLSFPRQGLTLAVDIANDGETTRRLLRDLDSIVASADGRVYPAKDASMTGEHFRAWYPEWERFARSIDSRFSSSFWRRVTG